MVDAQPYLILVGPDGPGYVTSDTDFRWTEPGELLTLEQITKPGPHGFTGVRSRKGSTTAVVVACETDEDSLAREVQASYIAAGWPDVTLDDALEILRQSTELAGRFPPGMIVTLTHGTVASTLPGVDAGAPDVSEIVHRRRNAGVDCTEEESAEILAYFDHFPPGTPAGAWVAAIFPLVSDQWHQEHENGRRPDPRR
ncbi:MAG: hypothetical protein ABWZ30_00990 [Jiangellaceae bacterium]